MLLCPNFEKPFILDIDWFIMGVGAMLSQREGRKDHVCKWGFIFKVQQNYHPMEGGYYAMIRGIMKFQCYPHHNHFTLHTNHKPFEFKLAIVSNAHGRKWRWVDLL